jgi:hypothetical protein
MMRLVLFMEGRELYRLIADRGISNRYSSTFSLLCSPELYPMRKRKSR